MVGWFTALSCIACMTAAASFSARMIHLQYLYSARKLLVIRVPTVFESKQMNHLRGRQRYWAAIFYIALPIQLIFVIIAKLLVLHRMQRFAITDSPSLRCWEIIGRLFLAALLAVNLAGLSGNIIAAHHWFQSASISQEAADAFAANRTSLGSNLQREAASAAATADAHAAVQRFAEVTSLIVLVSAFIIVGINCYGVVSTSLRALSVAKRRAAVGPDTLQLMDAVEMKGFKLLRKVFATVVLIFLTVLLRAAYVTFASLLLFFCNISRRFVFMYAVAQAFQNNLDPCAFSPCDPCHNIYSNIHYWILYVTPVPQCVFVTF